MKFLSAKKIILILLTVFIVCGVFVLFKDNVSADTAPPATDVAAMATQAVSIVNAERSKVGLPPLTVDPALTSAASVRSVELATLFSHTRPNGTSCFTAISNSFYTLLGENIAAGYSTADSVMAGWMSSAGHKDNILSSRFTSIGVSCYFNGSNYYWVQIFGEDPEISYDAQTGIKYEMAGSNCSVIGFYPTAGFNGTLSIPGSYNGSCVSSISQDAFRKITSLSRVTIPDAITTIGSSAFRDSQSLASVTLSNNLTSIAEHAFNNCSSLTSLSIPAKVKTIGYGAFANCGSLSSVIFKGKVDSIADYAFKLSASTGKNLTAFVPMGTKAYYAGLLSGNAVKNTTVTICEIPVASGITTKSMTYNSILIQWNSVGTLSGYDVFRSTSQSGSYTLIKSTTSKKFTDTGLTCGKTYFYRVKPYSIINDKKVSWSPTVAASAKPSVSVPTGLCAVGASSIVKLSWSAVSDANGYSIYRSATLSGTYTKIASTTYLEYKNTGLTAGTTYYYKIKAYRIIGTVPMYGNPTAAVSAKAN